MTNRTPDHAANNAAADRVVAAFPDRPLLCVDFSENADGSFAVDAGKPARMRRLVRSAPSRQEAERRVVAALRRQEAE